MTFIREIINKKGMRFVVTCDDEDADIVEKCNVNVRGLYAFCQVSRGGTCRTVHRMIAERMGMRGESIDHIDGNAMNNVRSNIRSASQRSNNRNRRAKGYTFRSGKGYFAQLTDSTSTLKDGSPELSEELLMLASRHPGRKLTRYVTSSGMVGYKVSVSGPCRETAEAAYEDYVKIKSKYHGGIIGRRVW